MKQGLPCGVVVCFPGSIIHVAGIEPEISRRKTFPAKWTGIRHKLSARVEVRSGSL